jgi:hypothetical protein
VSLATPSDLPAQAVLCEPVRGRIGRTINLHRRHAWILGLALWVGATVTLAVHGTGVGLPDATRFALLDTWLIAAGCAGCPNLALRSLGKYLTPYVCGVIAAMLASAAVLLTALVIGGQMHPLPGTATFGLILLLAGALQALNAAAAETAAAGREKRAARAGRLDALASTYAQSRAALAGIDQLAAMTVAELEALAEAVETLIEVKCSVAAPLHLLPPALPFCARGARTVTGPRYAPGDYHGN